MKMPAFHRVTDFERGRYPGRARASAVSAALGPAGTASLACLEQYAGNSASQCMNCGPDASCWASCAGLSASQAQRVVSCYSGSYNLV
jgi:hypothetical protein